MDIDVVLHGNGPAARWAARTRPGEPVRLAGPRGRRPTFDGAAHILLAADESALPAAFTILEQLPPGIRVSAYFEVSEPADTLPVDTAAELTTTWLPRSGAHPKGELLADTVRAVDVPDGTHAWLAGEAGSVAAVRRHLLTDWALPASTCRRRATGSTARPTTRAEAGVRADRPAADGRRPRVGRG
ncbi:siderophore-interacting protein [Kitasatospora aburaviensis]